MFIRTVYQCLDGDHLHCKKRTGSVSLVAGWLADEEQYKQTFKIL